MVQRHWSGGRVPKNLDRQPHSKGALYACLMYSGEVMAWTSHGGSCSPRARSMISTGAPSTLYAKSRISKSGLDMYFWAPALAIGTLE